MRSSLEGSWLSFDATEAVPPCPKCIGVLRWLGSFPGNWYRSRPSSRPGGDACLRGKCIQRLTAVSGVSCKLLWSETAVSRTTSSFKLESVWCSVCGRVTVVNAASLICRGLCACILILWPRRSRPAKAANSCGMGSMGSHRAASPAVRRTCPVTRTSTSPSTPATYASCLRGHCSSSNCCGL